MNPIKIASVFHSSLFSLLNMKTKSFLLLLISLISIGLGACKSSSGPSNPGGSTVSGPATGSTFTYQVIQFELDDLTPKTVDTETATVEGTQSSFEGMSNVVQFSNGDDFVYPSNGDVTAYLSETQPLGGGSEWLSLPFSGDAGSRAMFYSGDSEADAIHSAFIGAGPTLNANGTEIPTAYVRVIDSTAKGTSFGGTALYTQYFDYYYAPKINAMTEVDIGGYTNVVTGAQTGKKTKTLIQFSIK